MNNQGTSTKQESGVMTGLFRDRESTEAAYKSLRDRGYSDDDINVIMSDKTRDNYYSNDDGDAELGTKALEGTGAGAIVGGTLGAIIGGIAAIGTNVLLPGVGLIISGPLVAALSGVGAGGIAGGIVGALIGWGIPEDRAKLYENGIREGGTVLGVKPRSSTDADDLENDWTNNCRGESIYR